MTIPIKSQIEKLYHLYQQGLTPITDTRQIKPHSLFFALKGAHFNGNTFAAEALEKGADYAVIDEPQYDLNDRFILVDDVLKSLQELALFHRLQVQIPVIGITGSNGKTTTKELIAAVLQQKFATCYTQGNLNNHIGVPLSLLSIKKHHQIAVIEMGANHVGEIGFLSNLARPNWGIITNIGKAHLEGFGSLENILYGKTELYRFLAANQGGVFLNEDNPVLPQHCPTDKRIAYGTNDTAFCQGRIIQSKPYLAIEYSLKEGGDSIRQSIATQLVGDYNFENVLAAVTIGSYFGVAPDAINRAIEAYSPSNMRSQFKATAQNHLILDAYNANPSSMQAALTNFADIDAEAKVVILGDMLELGTEAALEHQKILEMTQSMKLDLTLLVGKEFYALRNTHARMHWFPDYQQAGEWLKENKLKGKTILIKGSRGIRLELLENHL